jgi:acyl carrier protein phosphodiesterase
MNYLGHLYFSGNDTGLMQANLYGDFIKGSRLDHLPEKIRQGIQLHRNIDFFIDNFPAVKDLQAILRAELPKVSGIAVDIYFDHLLARSWSNFHPQPLNDYLAAVYKKMDLTSEYYSADYLHFLKAMIRHNWMASYPTAEALDRMSRGVSSKLSFENPLVNGAAVFYRHEEAVKAAFFEYMAAASEHFLIEDHRILA